MRASHCSERATTIHVDTVHCLIAALMRDTSKIIAISRAGPALSRSQIQVFSVAGEGLLLLSVRILLCSMFVTVLMH